MQFRQKPDECIDDFVTKARTLVLKCHFTDEELGKNLIELIIASTPHDALRNDLYGKPQGYSLADVFKEGRKYKALSAGNEQMTQLGSSNSEKVHAIQRGRTSHNCSMSHQPRQCTAFHDICNACGGKGHWARCCKKTRQQQQKQDFNARKRSKSRQPQCKHSKHQAYKKGGKSQYESRIDAVDSYDPDKHLYQQQFHYITLSAKCMHSIDSRPHREEAYTANVRNVRPPDVPGYRHTLHLKIDTGASVNNLPLRTFRQIYGSEAEACKRLKKNGMSLSAYSGHEIPCFGPINSPCQYKDSKWISAKLYVVDVQGQP